ncbi:hypothetical protein BDF20DRAFT_888182 [Mycotypha africana]|uniref:uncharacterized protein n=1 Tax=Mycotypha africana TaxID=64632 RepID=UPI002300A1C4|nr:uncharacterized protein BDF20DRAFT_888182 [Mycotypha africana]KAI8972044.1 hypothetical protein BDF20DRAFT_888182 [Mycotypha africana]
MSSFTSVPVCLDALSIIIYLPMTVKYVGEKANEFSNDPVTLGTTLSFIFLSSKISKTHSMNSTKCKHRRQERSQRRRQQRSQQIQVHS